MKPHSKPESKAADHYRNKGYVRHKRKWWSFWKKHLSRVRRRNWRASGEPES